MAYGTIKADKIQYDVTGTDTTVNVSDIVSKAGIDSPAFTGAPTAPTAGASVNTTQLATTEYVTTAVAGVDISTKADKAGDTFTGPITIGADTDGHDVKFFGASTGKYCLWDESADKLTIDGGISVTGGSTFSDHANFGGQITLSQTGGNSIVLGSGAGFKQTVGNIGSQPVLMLDYSTCELYYEGLKKFETTTNGAKITGSLEVTSGIESLGASIVAHRFSTGDNTAAVDFFQVTNSGNPDTVDGRAYTSVYSTIQTGDAEDLFMELHENTIFEIKWDNPNGYANDSLSSTDYGRLASFKPREGVKLFYNDVKKFETTTSGVTVTGTVNVDGSYTQVAEAVSAVDIDLATGNYFTKTISSGSTFSFSNPPSSGTVGSFTLELTHSSGAVTWPTSVKWPDDTAPTLTTGKTHLFIFTTNDGGSRYRGAALVDYVN